MSIKPSLSKRLLVDILEDRTVPAISPFSDPHLNPDPIVGAQTVKQEFTSTEIMVQVQGTNGVQVLQQLLGQLGNRQVSFDWQNTRQILTHDNTSLVHLGLGAGSDPLAAVQLLSQFKQINWAEPNYISRISDPKELNPNDPRYGEQYFHPLMQNNLAWDSTLGSPTVKIAVLDDGVAINHPDLSANIWINPGEVAGDNIDNDNNGYIDDVNGWDVVDNDNDPNPEFSDTHGTHVSGIAAARTNNGIGVAGVAGNAKIVPIAWDHGTGWTASMVAAAYAYGVANDVKIFNASYHFGGWIGNATVKAALDAAYDSGALLFIAAANDNQLNPQFLDAFQQVVFVASTTNTDARSSFSNYGFSVDISAPGSGILSTVTSSSATVFDYDVFDGTSMASPAAAGAAALVWSLNPTWTRDQVIARLVGLADDLSVANPTIFNELGGGRVNSYKAMRGDLFTLGGPKVKRLLGLPNEGGAVNQPPMSFSIDFKNVLDPSTVVASNFELRGDGLDNAFGTGDDVLVPISLPAGFTYQIGTNRLNFTISTPLQGDRYRFTAFAGTNGIKDPFGTQLDGNGDGTAGDSFTRTFIVNAPSLGGIVFHDLNGDGVRQANEGGIAGHRVYIDANQNGVYDSTANTISYAGLPVSIPDNNTNWTNIGIVVTTVPQPVTDINVLLNITHTWDSDLEMRLLAPDGITTVNLILRRGSSGDNFTNTLLDDQASVSIANGTAPFTGSFRPEQVLNSLAGTVGNGTWTLQVRDLASTDLGTVQSWSITLTTAEESVVTDATGDFRFFAQPAGNHQVRIENSTTHNHTNATLQPVNLPAGGSVTGINFGLAQRNTVYGNVYHDQNSNGSQNGAEPGLQNWIVYHDINNNGTKDESKFTFNSSTLNLGVPDNNTSWTSTSLVVSGITGTLQDIEIKFNMTHTWVGDMEFRLVGPDGTIVNLITQRGGSGDDFINTVLDDQASIAIANGSAPFTGSFRPEQLLSALNGLNPNGTWTLQMRDMAAGDLGVLQNWSITITDSNNERSVVSNANGDYIFAAMPTGAYVLRTMPQVGWKPINPAYGSGQTGSISANQSVFGESFGYLADSVAPTVVSFKLIYGANQSYNLIGSTRFTVPWQITAIEVTFSEEAAATASSLIRTNGSMVVSAFSGVGTNTLRWTLQNSISTARVLSQLQASGANAVKDLAGNELGLGTNFSQNFNVLYGDINADGLVNSADMVAARNVVLVSGYNVFADLNGDGVVDAIDIAIARARLGAALPPG